MPIRFLLIGAGQAKYRRFSPRRSGYLHANGKTCLGKAARNGNRRQPKDAEGPRAVTNQINIISAHAILDVAKGRAVWMLESGFERLHPRAYKEGGGIVLGNDVG